MRTVSIDGTEYEILFDGAHHYCDCDLLTAERIPEKATVYTERGPTVQSRIVDALTIETPQTMRRLVQTTGVPISAVNSAVYSLKHTGRLDCRDTAIQKRHGRPEKEYFLTSNGAAHGNWSREIR